MPWDWEIITEKSSKLGTNLFLLRAIISLMIRMLPLFSDCFCSFLFLAPHTIWFQDGDMYPRGNQCRDYLIHHGFSFFFFLIHCIRCPNVSDKRYSSVPQPSLIFICFGGLCFPLCNFISSILSSFFHSSVVSIFFTWPFGLRKPPKDGTVQWAI